MNYYNTLKESLEKGRVKRIISLDKETLGEEAIFDEQFALIAKTAHFDDCTKKCEDIIAIKPHLVLFGAGHIGRALTELAKFLDFPVTVIDEREGIFENSIFSDVETFNEDYESSFKREFNYNNPYYIIFTHGHKYDLDCLRFALSKQSNYIGMIGSLPKIKKTYEDLCSEGFNITDLNKVHAPIGLDINANTPKEIAISIMSEIIKTYSKKHQLIVDNAIINYLAENKGGVLCTIVDSSGSSPRAKGAEMLVTENEIIGSIGGGAIEMDAINEAKKILKTKQTILKEYNLTSHSTLGMICGGDNTVLFRFISPQ